jgi:hypothetical protein
VDRGLPDSESEARASALSDGGANNEASQDLGPVLHLETVLLRTIAQPPLHGVVEGIDRANCPGPAPRAPRFLRLGHVGHVAPFLADGSPPGWRRLTRERHGPGH